MVRVLVVDDSRFSRMQIVDVVKGQGHDTVEAENGRAALNVLFGEAGASIDCVFSDLLMPEMNGAEFLREVRSRGSRIPVTICSADIQESSRQICRERGALSFIGKPIKKAVVAEALNEMIASISKEPTGAKT